MSDIITKYGFVYIWKDKSRNRFYIGSHWGTEDDGYICSSNAMREAYRRRPHDFKRRIIARITTSRQDLLNEEQRWLDMIPKREFGFQYYNINSRATDYAWWINEETRKQVSQKIKESTPKRKETWKKKFENGYVIHNKGKKNPEHSIKMKQKYAEGLQPWNKNNSHLYTEKMRKNMSNSQKGVHTKEYLAEIGKKGGLVTGKRAYAEKFGMFALTKEQKKEIQNKAHKGTIWINNGIINKLIKKEQQLPEGFLRGRLSKIKKSINNTNIQI